MALRHINAIGTVIVKASHGRLRRIVLNSTPANAVVSVYDDVSANTANLIAVITVTAIGTLVYDDDFENGLTVVMSGAAASITVSFH